MYIIQGDRVRGGIALQMPLMVKILKLQVEEHAEGRVGYQTLSRIIVFLSPFFFFANTSSMIMFQ